MLIKEKRSSFTKNFKSRKDLNLFISAFHASVFLVKKSCSDIECLKDDLKIDKIARPLICNPFSKDSNYSYKGLYVQEQEQPEVESNLIRIKDDYYLKMALELSSKDFLEEKAVIFILTPLCSDFKEGVLDKLVQHQKRVEYSDIIDSLSPREIQILNHIREGLKVKEIAEDMGISHHTVITHRKRLFKKLNTNKSSQLAVWAEKLGLKNN